MTLLLDTNVVSELRKPRPDPNLAAWAETITKRDAFISVVTIREIEAGVLLVERRDADQGRLLRAWLEERVLLEYADRLLDVDLAVARRAAALHVPDPRPERDALIAATALTHGLTVVTRNTSDFAPMGVAILNPWTDR
ncbi:MAG: type II toxin-antitoxin system VapC family toxin [Dermatophilaceae bacterium]